MLRVDIGCGDTKPEGFIGVDICAGPGVDIVADISKTLPFEDSSVDELRAYDVIEHLPDRINTMNEIWRVCKPGAKIDIFVPSTDGRGAFQDPTHISFWNINSFQYFCVDFPFYYCLCHKYGFKGAFKLLHIEEAESPGQVIHVKADLEVVKPAPEFISRSHASSTQTHSAQIPATIPAIPSIAPITESPNRPFWSVMIPVFNPQYDYLKQTLESVLIQVTDESEMQIEVVDDCSTEGDVEAWVKAIGQGRIRYTRQRRNLGLLANWNDCIKQAKGKWVHLLHQDDLVLPGFYDHLKSSIQHQEAIGAAFCRHFHIDEDGNQQYLSELERETSGILENFIDKIAVRQRIQFASIVVKRSTLEALGGFCTEAGSAADWELWLRISRHYPIWFEPKALAAYRLHSASESSKLIETGQNIADTRRSIEIAAGYLPQEKVALLNIAREYYARYSLNTARQMLQLNKPDAAIAQLREGLKCSQSSKVREELISVLLQSPDQQLEQQESLFLSDLQEYLTDYQKNPEQAEVQAKLATTQAEIASAILALQPEQLETFYQQELWQAHQLLLKSQFR
jgi:glycosyltransferase involved in cell wall biosynthesis